MNDKKYYGWHDVCPYSKNGICAACDILKIRCDGEKYTMCEQYSIKEEKKREADL